MLYTGSPIEALQRASEVLSDYWELVTMSDAPLDWSCQDEYTDSFGSTTDLSTESSTHFTGENLHLLESTVTDYAPVGGALGLKMMFCFLFFKQKVMRENQRRPRTENQSEICTSLASS